MKKGILILAFTLVLGVTAGLAQANVQIFFVACADQAVVNLSGTIEAGYDVYYQVMSAAGGGGSPITPMRRAVLDGTVAFSERLPYNSGATVAEGSIASIRMIVAREDDIESSTLDTNVDDVQDGCADPQHPIGASQDASAPAAATADAGPFIVSPFGGFLNPDLEVTPEPIVVIGARPHPVYRSPTPGLIFAECAEALPRATPGLIYNTDNVVIFWSWFASTEEQVQDHINNALYEVTLNRQPFFDVVVSPISKRGSNFFVFYTAQVGNLRPGTYGVQYRVTWETAISDGYADYGPGTANAADTGACQFTISLNPVRGNPRYNLMYSLP